MGWLAALLLTPLLGALLVAVLPARWARSLAAFASGLAFLLSVLILLQFDARMAGPQLIESRIWNPRLGTHFALAVDGISLAMVLLTTLLGACTVFASRHIQHSPRGYYTLLLVLESAVLGVFMARDWALFYVFWELTLIPLFFLIDHWGGEGRHRAALNFVLYTMGGSVFMLVSLLTLYDLIPQHTFDMAAFTHGGQNLAAPTQVLLFLGLLIGFGVKLPIVPLHGWLPLAHVEAPAPVSILLSGILLKMGAYGLLRSVEMFPAAALALQTPLFVLGATGLLYGGILAYRQTDLKAMIAYASISHMGIVLLGLSSLNANGITAAVLQMVAHGLTAALTFLLVGTLYQRTHERDLRRYGRLREIAPRFAFLLTIAFCASAGLPGSAGFIAELHVVAGGFARWGGWLLIVSLGVLIATAYGLRVGGHLLAARHAHSEITLQDLEGREYAWALGLIALIMLLGILPTLAIDLIGSSAEALARSLLAGTVSR